MKTMNEIISDKRTIAIFIVVFIAGLVLVMLPSNKKSAGVSSDDTLRFDEEEYEKNLETRLQKIVEEIDGVGNVEVMITLEGSAVYTYATDTTQDVSEKGSSKKESTVVLSTGTSSTKEAVISGYTLPRVKGAAVVCSNELTATLKSKVIGVVSAALGISTAKICVTS